jgi:hypothetical protein
MNKKKWTHEGELVVQPATRDREAYEEWVLVLYEDGERVPGVFHSIEEMQEYIRGLR